MGCSARTAASLERAASWLNCPSSTSPADAAAGADVVLLAVQDEAVEAVCASLAASGALGRGVRVLHTAGSLGLGVLRPAAEAGARVLAVHPLQTVPDIPRGLERLPGSWYGITCDDEDRTWAASLVEALGGRPLWVPEERRPLYHAAASMASNYLVTLAAMVERLWGEREPFLPLMAATLANLGDLPPRDALTGPVVRGDLATVARNLAALAGTAPELLPAYRCLATETVALAEAGGLPQRAAAELRLLLAAEG